MRAGRVEEVQCKTILNRAGLGFAEYTVNAYQGCVFGCSYCYVPMMRARRGQVDPDRWGAWVQVKTNAPDVLRREMLNVDMAARIAIGTAADSWQPLEKKYRIARRILEELAYYPNPVHIATRSPLLIRDIDVLARMQNVSVGVSIPTFDERARKVFEPDAPTIAGRVHLVRRLIEAGVRTQLFWCPLLPGVADTADAVRDYLRHAKELGVRKVFCETLNYAEKLAGPHMRLLRTYREAAPGPTPPSLTRLALSREIEQWSKRYGVACRL